MDKVSIKVVHKLVWEKIMSSKLTGWLLIASPIITMVAWFLSPLGRLGAPADVAGGTPGILMAIAADASIIKLFIAIAMIGIVGMAIGFGSMKKLMSGGAGYALAYIGAAAVLISIPGQMAEGGLIAGSAAAAALGEAGMGTGVALWSSGEAIGSLATGICFLGITLLGIGTYLQKNIHIISQVALTVIGIYGVVGAVQFYSEGLMAGAYVGLAFTSVAIGIELVRNKS